MSEHVAMLDRPKMRPIAGALGLEFEVRSDGLLEVLVIYSDWIEHIFVKTT